MKRLHYFYLLWIFFLLYVKATDHKNENQKEIYDFQADVNPLMDILVNSLYSKREVFLREVISNSVDALEKVRYKSISDNSILQKQKDLEIRISVDPEERTLTILDTGIGMTKEDLIQNLGTIAKSGTSQFVEKLKNSENDLNLIGQFGVGFYSVYLVSDKVRVTSKNINDDQYIWESTANSTFSIQKDSAENSLLRGTEIKLFLKDDASDFLNTDKLKTLIEKYSEFVSFPIFLKIVEEKEVPISDSGKAETEDSKEPQTEGSEEPQTEDSEEPKKEKVITSSWNHLNNQSAIWSRNKNDVSDEEYNNFFKSFSKHGSNPFMWIHFSGEGDVNFKSLLYVPNISMIDFIDYQNYTAKVHMYVRKVLVSDTQNDLLPRYLNFIFGVVDSNDLPVNVAREQLQQTKAYKLISAKLVQKILSEFLKINRDEQESKIILRGSEEPQGDYKKLIEGKIEKYNDLFKLIHKNIKLGILTDHENKEKLAQLLRFNSSVSYTSGSTISFDEYIQRKQSWQKDIYYISDLEIESILKSPLLENAKRKNVEVLFMTDSLDEFVVSSLSSYNGVNIVNIAKEGINFGDLDSQKNIEKIYEKEYKALTEWIIGKFKSLGAVSVSHRLVDTPAIVVSSSTGQSALMEKIMKHQDLKSSHFRPRKSKRVMEINPRHPIISEINKKFKENKDSEELYHLVYVVYTTALMNSGFEPPSAHRIAPHIYQVLKSSLNLKSLDLLPELTPTDETDTKNDL